MATTKTTDPLSSESTARERVAGVPDTTIVGDTNTREYADAIGFQTPGRIVDAHYDLPTEDARLLPALRPHQEDAHSIESILSRPTKIATITWTTQADRGGVLGTFDIVNILNTSDVFQLFRQKLSGFYGFHATATLKLLINPQPFQAGLLQIFYIPFQRTFTMFPDILNFSEASLPFATGCPNVYCNLSLQSSVELSVPYTGPQAFLNLSDLANRDWGTFFVQNISSIRDGTNQTSAEISVYMSFSDVKLYGATPRTWTTQGDRMAEASSKTQSNSNPITGLIGDVVGNLTGGVKLSKTLDQLGLSKPVVNQNPTRMLLSPYANITLGDSTSSALKLSFQQNQDTEIGRLGIDANDEMDINHIVSKPCYFRYFTWTDQNAENTNLVSLPVEPNATVTRQIGVNTYVSPTRLRYISSMFRFWRGTIRYTFHVVATKFHSGRLRFVYSLGGQINQARLGVEYPYSFTQVVDLRDGLTFAIDLPYFASTPWKSVPKNFQAGTYVDDDSSGFDDPLSYLQVFVENRLTLQSSAAASVEIIVMASGGSDYQLAAPSAMKGFPTQIEAPATVAARRRVRGLDIMNTEGDVLDIPVLNMVAQYSEPQTHDTNATTLTMGETITNVRALLRRYFPIGYSPGVPTTNVVMFPFVVSEPFIGASRNTRSYEFLSNLWPMYRFYRGGMRLLFATASQGSVAVKYDPYINPDLINQRYVISSNYFGQEFAAFELNNTDQATFLNQATAVTQPFNTSLQGGVEVEIPYYARTHKLITRYTPSANFLAIVTQTQARFYPEGALQMSFSSNVNAPIRIFRAVADDFNFGFLLGAPVVTINESITPVR